MSNVNFAPMRQAIINYINSKIPADPNKAHIGIVENNRVIIGNSSFAVIPTVDMYFGSGSKVACIRPNNVNEAVIVGVL